MSICGQLLQHTNVRQHWHHEKQLSLTNETDTFHMTVRLVHSWFHTGRVVPICGCYQSYDRRGVSSRSHVPESLQVWGSIASNGACSNFMTIIAALNEQQLQLDKPRSLPANMRSTGGPYLTSLLPLRLRIWLRRAAAKSTKFQKTHGEKNGSIQDVSKKYNNSQNKAGAAAGTRRSDPEGRSTAHVQEGRRSQPDPGVVITEAGRWKTQILPK